MARSTYRVGGMTCEHCVQAVEREVARLQGVSRVEVDLSAGTVAVDSDEPLDETVVRAAVDEAGYEFLPS